MNAATLVSSALLLASAPPVLLQGKKWDPFFDYTSLPPATQEIFASLDVPVSLEKALEVAKEAEGKLAIMSIELRPGENAYWLLELFVPGGADAGWRRVNLHVSAREPKVQKRLELLSQTALDEEAWKALESSTVDIAAAVAVGQSKVAMDDPPLQQARCWRAKLGTERGTPAWEVHLVGFNPNMRALMRHRFWVSAAVERIRRRELVDRFAGEPLRENDGRAIEHPNGLVTFDFVIGDGPEVQPDSKVKVNYRLFLQDNTKLHDTWHVELPETFLLSGAPLQGMTEGMPGMRVGGRRKIAMPYTLAFGDAQTELAPPKALVTCDVEVLEIVAP